MTTTTGQRLTAERERRIREYYGDFTDLRAVLDELDAVRAERDRAYAGTDEMRVQFAKALNDVALLDDAQKYLRELEAALPDAELGFSAQTVGRGMVNVVAIGPDDAFTAPDLRTALRTMLEAAR